MKMTEVEVKDKYPNVSLHEINKNRICLSAGQLEFIFKMHNKQFNNVFLKLCKNELQNKGGKSLDFYDLSNLIDQSLREINDKGDKSKAKHVSFKEDYEKKKEYSEIKMGSTKVETPEGLDVEKRLYLLENKLKSIEQRLDDVEEAIKEGY